MIEMLDQLVLDVEAEYSERREAEERGLARRRARR